MSLTPTELRTNLYNILDQVIKTGNPVEIIRHGHILKIVADAPKSKLERLTKHPGTIKGSPEDLVHLDWYHEWDKEE
jgi:hypothetical protein